MGTSDLSEPSHLNTPCLDVQGREKLSTKQWMHARVFDLPNTEDFVRPNISAMRSSDQGRFLQVSGTVTRTSQLRMVERQRTFQCTRCKHLFACAVEIEHDNTLDLPKGGCRLGSMD